MRNFRSCFTSKIPSLSALDHEHRAAAKRYLERAAEHVCGWQGNERSGRIDLDLAVAVDAVRGWPCDADRDVRHTDRGGAHDIDNGLLVAGVDDDPVERRGSVHD